MPSTDRCACQVCCHSLTLNCSTCHVNAPVAEQHQHLQGWCMQHVAVVVQHQLPQQPCLLQPHPLLPWQLPWAPVLQWFHAVPAGAGCCHAAA